MLWQWDGMLERLAYSESYSTLDDRRLTEIWNRYVTAAQLQQSRYTKLNVLQRWWRHTMDDSLHDLEQRAHAAAFVLRNRHGDGYYERLTKAKLPRNRILRWFLTA